MEKSWKITLSDGTKLKNLELSRNNYISKTKITEDDFKGKLSKITIENNNNMKTVSKIENILKSESLILKKYNNAKIKQKYNDIDEYKKSLNNMRKNKIEEINRNNNLINPFEYVKRKKNIEKEVIFKQILTQKT